ncbi:MAG: cytochrome b/b6 domain-containing protein, partial [Alphaproteobacteria bacterium]|nr:cytochrome b/b6 domain-containing protein [Alphaproteobacteria bacterium]
TGMLAETHEILAFLTIALIVLHVAGALYHHFIHRDQVLKRMVPGTKVAGDIGQAGG